MNQENIGETARLSYSLQNNRNADLLFYSWILKSIYWRCIRIPASRLLILFIQFPKYISLGRKKERLLNWVCYLISL